MKKALIIVLLSAVLSGCGFKGNLYLDNNEPSDNQPPTPLLQLNS